MTGFKKVIGITAVLLAPLFSLSLSVNINEIDLISFEGSWEGNGEFLMPITNMAVAIEGKANFKYDSANGYLRTALTGSKFLFSYSDSGHLYYDKQTDSILWEIWDNYSRHAKYEGKAYGNIVKGTRYRKKNLYSVMIEMVTKDSINFKLMVTNPEGNSIDKAVFHLWRVEDFSD